MSANATGTSLESPRHAANLEGEMKVIIAGARTFSDFALLKSTMASCGWAVDEVVSGCARGADTLGELWAMEQGIPVKRFPK